MLEYLHASKNVGFEYDDLERTSDGTIKKGLGWNTLMLASLNQRYGKWVTYPSEQGGQKNCKLAL